ncbi:MAG: two-component sensor histidine kinase, partial [Brucella anthropi]
MSEAGNRTDPEPQAEKSIFEPLLPVKGVLIASMVLAVCVLALDLP